VLTVDDGSWCPLALAPAALLPGRSRTGLLQETRVALAG